MHLKIALPSVNFCMQIRTGFCLQDANNVDHMRRKNEQ